MSLASLSEQVEALLVSRNPRQMARLREALAPGYYLRAAHLLPTRGRVLIGTGFPVAGSFETDGPLGAIALYRALEQLGCECTLAAAPPLATLLAQDFRVLELGAYTVADAQRDARRQLDQLDPHCVISIERPGLAADGRYYNMRGVDISERCAIFDHHLLEARCPTIGIGDGGNEIGMGKLAEVVATLAITPARTSCDELLVADVSNWGAYGLIALLQAMHGEALLDAIDHRELLAYLSAQGSVDGVTGENTLTEDGLPLEAGLAILDRLRALCQDHPHTARE